MNKIAERKTVCVDSSSKTFVYKGIRITVTVAGIFLKVDFDRDIFLALKRNE